ncbi:hypothetical protein [Mycobacterium sp. 852014-52144_SCH5372336]|uniref:DUF7159 family protein n=1 Tax=Mycobacterium sp. 852014-52144_SCH5372336 TaxID=1834115 RepID=UPI0007FF2EA5|nr:hypothetical protein [Mycobacterium sp. 852014-52144_SCH5372336]OBB70929.1 hypothetical protein A5759_24890 [Mycobacterium sp. 852014-52144_SCH5372336]
MDTVLGLSMTSTGIAWVLLEGEGADAKTVDHDHFTVVADVATDGDISTHEAAVRGARAIASASGHRVEAICMTWSADVDAKAELLRKSLSDMGFTKVATVRMTDAARTWAGTLESSDEFDDVQVAPARGAALSRPVLSAAAPSTPVGKSTRQRSRRRLSSHGRAAMVLAAGVVALFAFGPELAGWDSPDARVDPSAETAPMTPAAAVSDAGPSISVHAVPSAPVVPIVVKQVIPRPVPAPAAVASPEAVSDVATDTAVAAEVTAQPATETVAPVAHLHQAPIATVVVAQAAPAAPSPAPAAQPATAPPAFVPPADPIQAALSPLFGGLP